MIAVSIEGREVWIRPWLHRLRSPIGHTIPVLLLDSDLEQNTPEDRKLTNYLYGGDAAYRLKQEILLGIGGERILQALGFDITTFHLNEGHAALLTLQLLHESRRTAAELRPGEPLTILPPCANAASSPRTRLFRPATINSLTSSCSDSSAISSRSTRCGVLADATIST